MFYVLIYPKYDENDFVCGDFDPATLTAAYRLAEAEPLSKTWGSDVTFKYSEGLPVGKNVADFVRNTKGLLIVNEKVKKILSSLVSNEDMEYLPIKLLVKKGVFFKGNLWIAHPLKLTSCVDKKKSKFKQGAVYEISSIAKLALRAEVEKGEEALYRFAERPDLYLIRDDVKSVFEKQKITGVQAIPVHDFKIQ